MFAKIFLLFFAIAVLASAMPQNGIRVQLLRDEREHLGLGSRLYRFRFELSDFTKREEQGELVNEGTSDEALSVKGSYSYISPDGTNNTVTYTADNNGYHPSIMSRSGLPSGVVASLLG